jgi:hypothetical protein
LRRRSRSSKTYVDNSVSDHILVAGMASLGLGSTGLGGSGSHCDEVDVWVGFGWSVCEAVKKAARDARWLRRKRS